MQREQESSTRQLRLLAEFRHRVRMFLLFSEEAAGRQGLEPQQHQLLLQIAGAPEGTLTTIGYLAERLGLRHNSVVELSKRSEESGLVVRRQDKEDRRRVLLTLTRKGVRVLDRLSADHAEELTELAPLLMETLAELSSPRKLRKAAAGRSLAL